MVSINKIGEVPIHKLIVSISLPIMIAILIQTLYNIVNRMFVVYYLQEALTAISLFCLYKH